jgi:hypothetical protein
MEVVTTTIRSWWQDLLLRLRANKLARAAIEECWTRVRVKAVVLPPTDVAEYMRKHSAAVIHEQVDALLRHDPSMDGSTANHLIATATESLLNMLERRLARQKEHVSRAA